MVCGLAVSPPLSHIHVQTCRLTVARQPSVQLHSRFTPATSSGVSPELTPELPRFMSDVGSTQASTQQCSGCRLRFKQASHERVHSLADTLRPSTERSETAERASWEACLRCCAKDYFNGGSGVRAQPSDLRTLHEDPGQATPRYVSLGV
eukprot:356183-Chlamydomonas_euryale.AAC.3